MLRCKEPDLGRLLHAYELDVLSQEDTERFEIHLLECEYCFNQVKEFEQQVASLRSDRNVRNLVKDVVAEREPQSQPFLRRLWRHLWPDTPVVFKPALAYLLILLLLFPTYRGLRKVGEGGIRPVYQTIDLFPGRSASEDVFKIGIGDEGLVRFIFVGATVGESYRVAVESEDGSVIFKDDAFSSFDEYESARLLLSLAKMKPGNYRLVITDPRAEPPRNRQEYNFRIDK